MELTTDQGELFAVIAEKVKPRSFLRQYIDATNQHGALAPISMIAAAIGCSRQRVHVLVNDDKLASVAVAGRKYVPASSLELFLTEERKTGVHRTPAKLSTLLGSAFK